MLKAIRITFKYSLPVLFGYIPLGMAFGFLLRSAGYGPLWAFVMSVVIFGGTAQYLIVGLLSAGASVPQVALMTFLLHFRHIFYGVSTIPKFRGIGAVKWYLMFGLTDETYALIATEEVPKGLTKTQFYTALTALNHSYWIIGGVLGASLGSLININTKGMDFVMTALFTVLVVEQWKAHKIHLPAFLGFGVTIAALLVFGADNFLVPALIVITAVLLIIRPYLENKEARL